MMKRAASSIASVSLRRTSSWVCGAAMSENVSPSEMGRLVAMVALLRADQSASRQGMDFVSHDSARGLMKANPLFDWSRERIAAMARAEDIPINPLHERGFLSIGCAPCTRAVAPGEPERAGRWWWEEETAKECGLHVTAEGRLARAGVRS